MKTIFTKKSKEKILKSIAKIEMVLLMVLLVFGFAKIQGTNSFFMDSATVTGNTMTAGYWIPTLTYTMDKSSPDGQNGWYVNKPCIKLFSDIDDVTIHYSFTGDNPESGIIAEDTCVNAPEGTNNFSAYAVNNANASWVSNTVSRDFKVDTVAPSVPNWIRPENGAITHQSRDILIDWSDSTDAASGVAGYIYENTKVGGSTWSSSDACPGHALMDESQFPNDQVGPGGTCIDAPAGSFSADGSYDRKVRAEDEAGNKSGWSNEWRLTRDIIEPTSHADAFSPATTSNLTFDVAYSASDDRAGVKNVKLFYRKDGGSWTQYGTTFSSSPISFTATGIGVYDFYTIAEDKADDLAHADMADGSDGDDGDGNIETKTALVEATMTVTAPAVGSGDVVINEVMWMGSQRNDGDRLTADEWIELKNTTGHGIDVKNWNIYGIKNGGHFEIAGGSSVTIPAGGYLLISDRGQSDSLIDVTPDFTTNNLDFEDSYAEHGKIILKDEDGVMIDETPDPSPSGSDWPAGLNENHTRWSMERNNTPSSGWHTCNPTVMTTDQLAAMQSYWDGNARLYNCGTPGHANLSKNDPSKSDIEKYFNKNEIKESVFLEPLMKELKIAKSMESENISKNIPVKIIGALNVAEGLKYKINQRIKKVNLSGDFPDKEIEIDLDKLGLIEKTGEIKIRIKDLDLPEGVKIVSPKKNGLVLLITVEKQKDKIAKKNKSGKKLKKKGKAEIKETEQVPPLDSGKESANSDPSNPI